MAPCKAFINALSFSVAMIYVFLDEGLIAEGRGRSSPRSMQGKQSTGTSRPRPWLLYFRF